MWQSQRWDGRQPAFRILMCISVVILIVLQEDKKSVPQRDHQPPAKKGGRADEVID